MKYLFTLALSVCFASALAQCTGCKTDAKEEAFLREANLMMLKAEGKEACDKTTAHKKIAKGEPGCCEAPGAPRPYKVFVAGKGYQFFSCPDSAGEARKKLLAQGTKVGPVQKVAKK